MGIVIKYLYKHQGSTVVPKGRAPPPPPPPPPYDTRPFERSPLTERPCFKGTTEQHYM